MNLEYIILSETSQSEKDKYCLTGLTRRGLFWKRQTHRSRAQYSSYQGPGWGRMSRGRWKEGFRHAARSRRMSKAKAPAGWPHSVILYRTPEVQGDRFQVRSPPMHKVVTTSGDNMLISLAVAIISLYIYVCQITMFYTLSTCNYIIFVWNRHYKRCWVDDEEILSCIWQNFNLADFFFLIT